MQRDIDVPPQTPRPADLRDQFAMAALAGIAYHGPDAAAEKAYQIADAMMKARG